MLISKIKVLSLTRQACMQVRRGLRSSQTTAYRKVQISPTTFLQKQPFWHYQRHICRSLLKFQWKQPFSSFLFRPLFTSAADTAFCECCNLQLVRARVTCRKRQLTENSKPQFCRIRSLLVEIKKALEHFWLFSQCFICNQAGLRRFTQKLLRFFVFFGFSNHATNFKWNKNNFRGWRPFSSMYKINSVFITL